VLTNPHDPADLTAGLLQALSMPEEEAGGRMRQLFGSVEYYDVDRWGREFLEAVRGTEAT